MVRTPAQIERVGVGSRLSIVGLILFGLGVVLAVGSIVLLFLHHVTPSSFFERVLFVSGTSLFVFGGSLWCWSLFESLGDAKEHTVQWLGATGYVLLGAGFGLGTVLSLFSAPLYLGVVLTSAVLSLLAFSTLVIICGRWAWAARSLDELEYAFAGLLPAVLLLLLGGWALVPIAWNSL